HAPPARAAVCRHGEDPCRRHGDAGGRRGRDGIAHGGRGVLIAGVDEAGRGPLAGPVVAAAVILHPTRRIPGLRDSKLLTAPARSRLAIEIRMYAVAWAVAESDVGESGRAGDARAVPGASTQLCSGYADFDRLPVIMKTLPKALLFDVFGTVVDWRGSIVRELRRLARSKGVSADWGAFADAWRR